MKSSAMNAKPITLAEYRQRMTSGTLTKQDHANMIAVMKALQEKMKATAAELKPALNEVSENITTSKETPRSRIAPVSPSKKIYLQRATAN